MISKQGEPSKQYEDFKKILKQKNINVLIVKKGDRVAIEKNVYFDILWPKDQLMSENILNNNYFSMLFTGDIEEVAEKQMLDERKTGGDLRATILKVAHHRFKNFFDQRICRDS